MMGGAGTLDDRAPFRLAPASRNAAPQAVVGPLVLAMAVLIGTGIAYIRLEDASRIAGPLVSSAPKPASPPVQISAPVPMPAAAEALPFDSALLDASYSLGAAPATFGQNLPQGPHFVIMAPPPAIAIAVDIAPAPAVAVAAAPPPAVPAPVTIDVAEAIPLPAPRPSALQILNPRDLRVPPNKTMASIKPSADDGNLFDRLFGARPAPPALAYAAPEAGLFGGVGRATFNPTTAYDGSTAVYDISAHTVYLPNGTRLEAHSGLGSRLDDPRYVAEQNRGPTPPHVYDLQPREQLFHGVAALRLNPVGGGGIFGRTGLLAHTYMLGPNGDSNGCVSFSNYRAFLAAYQRGEIKRLAVVARLN